MIMPYGDPKDKLLIHDEILFSTERDDFRKISERYGTRNVVVVSAKPRIVDDRLIMHVSLRRAGSSNDEAVFRYVGTKHETVRVMMERAAEDIASKLSNAADRYDLFNSENDDSLEKVVLRVNFENARQWLRVKKMINDLPSVRKAKESTVTIDYAVVTLYYKGRPAVIKRGLLAKGLDLKEKPNYWVVKLN